MRVVFCSDTHLGVDLPVRPRVERERRGERHFENFERVLVHASAVRAHLVLLGGDIFFRSKVPPAIVDRVYARLAAFADGGIDVALIAGNHERAAMPRSLFLTHPRIHVFHAASTRTFEGDGVALAVTGVPFVGRAPRLLAHAHEEQASRRGADARLLLAHEAFDGARVGPSDFTFRARARDDTVPLDALPDDLDLVVSGHIHRRQVLWRTRTDGTRAPILYAGSTERTSPAENGEDKGFLELHIGRGAGAHRVRFITLPSAPLIWPGVWPRASTHG